MSGNLLTVKYHFRIRENMSQTERNLRQMLSKLPDNKLRMLAEGIEISPFPILINKEYKKRFGGVDIRLKNSLKKQIRAKQVEQKKLLRNVCVEIKKLEQQSVSVSGLEHLSEKSIAQIHHRQKHLVENIAKNVRELAKSCEHGTFLERDLSGMFRKQV
jgi:hypothetical protein